MMSSAVATTPITQALRDNSIPALRQLAIVETEQEVVISGTVASYYLKQMAQEALMPYLDGRALHNRVAVGRE